MKGRIDISSKNKWVRTMVLALLLAYVVLLLWGTLFSREAFSEPRCRLEPFHQIRRTFDLKYGLLESIRRIITTGKLSAGIKVRDFQDNLQDMFINIGIFLPVGFLLAILFIDKMVIVPITIAAGLTCTIELLQYFTRRGCFETDDIIFNSAGFFIGFVIIKYVISVLKNKCNKMGK